MKYLLVMMLIYASTASYAGDSSTLGMTADSDGKIVRMPSTDFRRVVERLIVLPTVYVPSLESNVSVIDGQVITDDDVKVLPKFEMKK